MAGDTVSLEDAYDTDTISLTSTVSDEYNEYRIWDVEDIVAEGYEDGRKMWLIKWEGFGWEECGVSLHLCYNFANVPKGYLGTG